jgi:hypothetical protein
MVRISKSTMSVWKRVVHLFLVNWSASANPHAEALYRWQTAKGLKGLVLTGYFARECSRMQNFRQEDERDPSYGGTSSSMQSDRKARIVGPGLLTLPRRCQMSPKIN